MGVDFGRIKRLDFRTRADGWLLDDVLVTLQQGDVDLRCALSIKSNAQFSDRSASSPARHSPASHPPAEHRPAGRSRVQLPLVAINYLVALTNSRGLARAVFFSGLDFPAAIYPAFVDEPLLTRQPFYFLSRQECIAKVRFKDGLPPELDEPEAVEQLVDALLDNYLFAYSRLHPEAGLTTKVHELVLRPDMTDGNHFAYDSLLTECLAFDPSNDDTIIAFRDGDEVDQDTHSDYVLVRDYIDPAHERYVKEIQKALGRMVTVETRGNAELGTGTTRLPIATVAERLWTYDEMQLWEKRTTSSGVEIDSLNCAAVPLVEHYAERLYAIRNACIHSKHTRRGRVEARIVPSLAEESLLTDELPVLQELAARFIERDGVPGPIIKRAA